MKKKYGARELELAAASAAAPKTGAPAALAGEVMAMLSRRGFRPERTAGDVPFPPQIDESLAERIADWLGHYAFRLFLRGAIQKPEGFVPVETTRYLTQSQAWSYAEILVNMGLAEKASPGRYRLKWPAKSFGGTLEWYVGRELARRFGFDVATGVKLHVPGVG